jgi:hypothetical protein
MTPICALRSFPGYGCKSGIRPSGTFLAVPADDRHRPISLTPPVYSEERLAIGQFSLDLFGLPYIYLAAERRSGEGRGEPRAHARRLGKSGVDAPEKPLASTHPALYKFGSLQSLQPWRRTGLGAERVLGGVALADDLCGGGLAVDGALD